ncbi:hypothetical protein [Streptomyces sp. NPDC048639]|uniref:hypothetical protein n=1 Tax=Streptomyces sp. NPDC048639 TaxID=3365581 RepID=UPI003712ABEA
MPPTSRRPSVAAARAHTVRLLPAPSVLGFALLLLLVFAASYGAGTLAGPVAPAMRPASDGGSGGGVPGDDVPAPGSPGGADGGGMGGMHGMGGSGPVRGEAR